jgi:hypothetical protein
LLLQQPTARISWIQLCFGRVDLTGEQFVEPDVAFMACMALHTSPLFVVKCRLVHVPPPDTAARAAIFAIQTRNTPLAADVTFDSLAHQTENFTGAMIATCCKDAALAALEEDMNAACVSKRHFEMAIASRNAQNKVVS